MYYVRSKCKNWYVYTIHGASWVSWISVGNFNPHGFTSEGIALKFPKEAINRWVNLISKITNVDCEAVLTTNVYQW